MLGVGYRDVNKEEKKSSQLVRGLSCHVITLNHFIYSCYLWMLYIKHKDSGSVKIYTLSINKADV